MGFDSAGAGAKRGGRSERVGEPNGLRFDHIRAEPGNTADDVRGIVETVSFNTRMQLSQIQAGSLTTGYDFGSANNNGDVRSSTITHSGQQAIQAFYTYDGVNRLKAAAEYGGNSQSACGTATCYLSVDQIGSTRLVTDSNGNVIRRYDYLPFGEELWAGTGHGDGLIRAAVCCAAGYWWLPEGRRLAPAGDMALPPLRR
jgi:hypothetical protein